MSNNLMSLLGLITDERIIEENFEFNMTNNFEFNVAELYFCLCKIEVV